MAISPPSNAPITDPKTGKSTDIWNRWFNLIRTSTDSAAPSDATYITKVPNTGLSNEQALSLLDSGFVKVTTSTGALTSTGFTTIQTNDIADDSITAAKLVATAVTAGSYTINGIASYTVDADGRLTSSASPVITITGTTDKITVTGGTGSAPTITIASTYVGQTSITTLGTITTGVWNGTTIAVANGGTGITSFGTGVATWLGTPSSANLISAITDETGSGSLVFANTPTLVTPVLGAATATSINRVAITAPASSATLTIANTKTLTVNGDTTLTSGTHSGTNTGDQNIFSTIAVSGQSDVVADTTSDTLTLVAGTNMTLTTSAAGDSVTFAASGSAGWTVLGGSAYTTAATTAFTPNANTTHIYYELGGGGGGGGGGDNGGNSQCNAGGGASGSIARGIITRAQAVDGGTQLQIITGAAGTGGTAGNNNGGTGGTSTLIGNNGAGSTIASCLGGLGGVGATAAGLNQVYTSGGLGQAATVSVGTQLLACNGNAGGEGLNGNAAGSFRGFASCGANSPYGAGGLPQITADSASNAGLGNCSGGAGAHSITVNTAGGAGTAGYCLILEFRTS